MKKKIHFVSKKFFAQIMLFVGLIFGFLADRMANYFMAPKRNVEFSQYRPERQEHNFMPAHHDSHPRHARVSEHKAKKHAKAKHSKKGTLAKAKHKKKSQHLASSK